MPDLIKLSKECVFYSSSGYHEYAMYVLKHLEPKLKTELNFEHTNFEDYGDREPADRIVSFEEIRNKTVIFFCSLYDRDLYYETIDLVTAMKRQYGAKHIILVISFMIFRRQDHDEVKVINNKKFSEISRLDNAIFLFKCIGVDEIITVTPHSKKMAEYCQKHNLLMSEIDTSMKIAEKFKIYLDNKSLLVSPDEGSIERTIKVAESIYKLTGLNVPIGFFLKTRGLDHNSEIKDGDNNEIQCIIQKYTKLYSNIHYADQELIKGKKIFIIDDEAATFNTAKKVAKFLLILGALLVYYAATHPVLIGPWRDAIDSGIFENIILGDTIPRPYPKQTGGKIDTFITTDLVANELFLAILSLTN